MRFLCSVSLLAAGLIAAAMPQALAQSRGTIEQTPLPPPGTIPNQRPLPQVPNSVPVIAAPPAAPAQRPAAPAAIQRGPAPPPPPAAAQQPPAGMQPAPPGDEGDVVVVQPPTQKIANAYAVYAGLDKITGRITSFDIAIGETAQFGALQVTPRVCYTRPATETQNTTSFTEVNEVTLQGQAKRIFTGWMFAASPGLHAVEHPIYDVWLIGCKAASPVTARGQQ
ncbi:MULTISPECIES: DUF2155 domain-containing protein [Xanthobacter]|uniref:DUF2155 domain-containing protein n=1 Tax=Xanthobacter TaxID=279 RepID=UPI002022E46C|nr:DUF2155 domain-containing protein [Xanthobacter aminoxidans]MCL8383014.1 DUF2155 domain-containing protein [Xanthobacter aminoxidans]